MRPPASAALIALREAMRMTQAQFAVLILDCAITTVGRYETSHPPHSDQLLRLAKIAEREASRNERSPAEQKQFAALADRFKELYMEEAIKTLGRAWLRAHV